MPMAHSTSVSARRLPLARHPGSQGAPVPEGTRKHSGPEGHGHLGHLGDLPVLTVGADGTAREELTAARIKDLGAVGGRALMIHAGGDNYADEPRLLGGGGARIACGVLR